MLILLLTFFLFQSYYADAGQGLASIELRDVSACGYQDSRRSIWSIVWSCLLTIFLCTWMAVHPNIAFRPERPNAGWLERWIWDSLRHFWSYQLPLFMWALLVPEYILSWSIRQFVVAGKIRKKVPGWTRTHGFFMLMGGFHLFRLPANTPVGHISSETSGFVTPLGYSSREEEVPVHPLQIDDIPVAILEIISPTETELKDRGKSDWLTKLIVLVQTLWFVIQCIARGKQHLPLTELEVITLAYTILNFFTYIFWWDKPQNVGCPIRVYETLTAKHKRGRPVVTMGQADSVAGLFRRVIIYLSGDQDNYVDYSLESSLPMLWSGLYGSNENDATLPASGAMSLLAMVFGGIHFIAWSSDFPSRAELILWRMTCILLTVVPPILLIAPFFNAIFTVSRNMKLAVFLLLPPLYIAGRAATLLIAFTTLRSLPDAAFIDVDWTTFIPHI